MKTADLLELIGEAQAQYIMEAAQVKKGKQPNRHIFSKKIWVIAAIIAAMLLLMGCAWIVRITIASNPDYPMVEPSSVENKDIQIYATEVCRTGMHVFVQIKGFEYGAERAITMLRPGPFTLERHTDNGWEALPVLMDDPQWNADAVWTDGYLDWYVNWSTVYGILDNGLYRYVFVLLEGHEPVYCEFTVSLDSDTGLDKGLNDILNADAYCIRLTSQRKFDALDSLSDSQREEILSENAVWVYEYWKSGKDLLHLVYRNDVLWVGMMYKNGIKYTLDHEGENRTQPVVGWSVWPDMDPNRMTEWIHVIVEDLDSWTVVYASDGALKTLTKSGKPEKYGQYSVNAWKEEKWEFFLGDGSDAAAKIAEQDVDIARDFSWDYDLKNVKSIDVEFANTRIQPVSCASEAIARAMEECTVEYDKIVVYRDASAGMWKIEFQILYGYQGYQYVYLDDDGITRMVAGDGSKVPEWQDEFPGP